LTRPVLEVEGLSKKYCRSLRRSQRYAVADTLREFLPWRNAPTALRPEEFWAIDDVSFTVAPGEALAVLGSNGAGKSTLLRMICGLLKPDKGRVRIRGRVGAIIELGAGFDPLLTGRENVEFGAMQFGLGHQERARLLDEAIAFADLAEFIDAPLQSYSSGMKARLAFALAAHGEPALLLVDEVLAVGDLDFQRRCADHMRRYIERGGALAFVSHNAMQVQAVCSRAILLEEGRAVMEGPVAQVVGRTLESRRTSPAPAVQSNSRTGAAGITALRIEGVTGEPPATGRPATLVVDYHLETAADVYWEFSLWSADRWVCIAGAETPEPVRLGAGPGRLRATLPRMPLLPGDYTLSASFIDPKTHFPVARFGHEGPGVPVRIGGHSGTAENRQRLNGQLVYLNVDWA
jgi:ABC-type polysaccharide/polyol phosphate transport system ATPase subunit